MDLLAGYGSNDESDASDTSDQKDGPKETKAAPNRAPAASAQAKKKAPFLPSAADMFSSAGASSFLAKAAQPMDDVLPVKKQKIHAEAPKAAPLLPPQLTRGANKVSEDSSQWNTAKSAKAKKDSFNQKEKRKRQEGKVAREGSFVEEEKRLLRQAGAD
mmetsp:Transcript_24847/g.55979  ORF Transcript_24847/g.55979 Transcript_24847/m.55979 type:complete len:159 (-) Transcript_24847:8-484(-)